MVWTVALAILAAGSPPAQPIVGPRVTVTPAALALFERDWVLMNWALKYFDLNHDVLLQPNEAEAAEGVSQNGRHRWRWPHYAGGVSRRTGGDPGALLISAPH